MIVMKAIKQRDSKLKYSIVARPAEILVGLRSIGEAFGVGEKKLKQWKDLGAPIVKESDGYRAEKWELWVWIRESN